MAMRLIGCLRSRSQWAAGLVQAISTAGVSQSHNYERLEYLGDAWLKYIAVAKVYNRYVGQRWVLLSLSFMHFGSLL
jgi:dsRNA-specific ribonuclease